MPTQLLRALQPFSHASARRQVDFYELSGTVIADKIWSETHVSSSGGGGYLNQGSGHISAPKVSSSVSTKREIWIRQSSGFETSIQAGDNVKVNAGNDVSVLYCGTSDSSYPIVLVNRTTQHWHGIAGQFDQYYLRNFSKAEPGKEVTALGRAILWVSIPILVICAIVTFPLIVFTGIPLVMVGFLILALVNGPLSKYSSTAQALIASRRLGSAEFKRYCEALCAELF